MSISANSLINDSVNFFKNQLGGLFTIALLAAVVSVIIYAILIPDPQLFVTYLESLKKLTEVGSQGAQYWLENMTDQEKNAIIHVFFGTLLPTILGSTILICGFYPISTVFHVVKILLLCKPYPHHCQKSLLFFYSSSFALCLCR